MKINGIRIAAFLTGALFCIGSPAFVSAQSAPADELDAAMREASDYFNKQLTRGNKLVILNVQSEFPALSEYIIDELTANTVNDRVFSVVDRQQLDTIRAEMDFQMSGEVDDETAQSLGRMAGAQTIVSGAVSRMGDLYRLRLRALSVQSAQIEGQFNRNIPNGPTLAALAQSRATGYGGTAAAPASGGTAQRPAAQAATPVPVAPKTYKIGDTGPGGGLVFYDKGAVTNGWRYMEAAPYDIGPARWGPENDVKGTGTAPGTGKANTQRIVPVLEEYREDGAALLCTALNVNGYADWFLPSSDELDLMYKNLKQKGLGGFGNGDYWSSSRGNSDHAYVQNLGDGYFGGSKSNVSNDRTCSVRACRQF
jgi:hypothetical protein